MQKSGGMDQSLRGYCQPTDGYYLQELLLRQQQRLNEFTGLVFLYDCSEVSVSRLYDISFIKQFSLSNDKMLAKEFTVFYMQDVWSCVAGTDRERDEEEGVASIRHKGCA